MAKVVKKVAEENPIELNKAYEWNPNDIFEITGEQYAKLYHALNQQVNNVGGAPLSLIYNAYNVVMDILKDGISQGVIVEKQEPRRIDDDTTQRVNKAFNSY